MRLLYLIVAILAVLSSTAQESKKAITEEEYKVIDAVFDNYNLNKFLLDDENYNYKLLSAFGVYIHWYIKFLETGENGPPTSKGIEWILDSEDISDISLDIEYDKTAIKWDKYKLNRPEIIYSSEYLKSLTSEESQSMGLVQISKPYLNRDKTKAVVFIIADSGYLVLAKKTGDGWKVCGKIFYIYS